MFLPWCCMAAQNDCPEIVQLFLEKGYVIKEPLMHKKIVYRRRMWKPVGKQNKSLNLSFTQLPSAGKSYLFVHILLARRFYRKTKHQIVQGSHGARLFTELEIWEPRRNGKWIQEWLQKALQPMRRICCFAMEEISCIMSVPGVDQLEHVEVRGWKEAQKLSVLNFAIANKNEKVRAIYIASVSSGRLKDFLSVQIKWELFWLNKTNCGNKPIIDFSLVAGMRETDYRIYSNTKAPRRLFNFSRHKCGGYSRAALIAGPIEARNPNLDSDQRISYYACVPCL